MDAIGALFSMIAAAVFILALPVLAIRNRDPGTILLAMFITPPIIFVALNMLKPDWFEDEVERYYRLLNAQQERERQKMIDDAEKNPITEIGGVKLPEGYVWDVESHWLKSTKPVPTYYEQFCAQDIPYDPDALKLDVGDRDM